MLGSRTVFFLYFLNCVLILTNEDFCVVFARSDVVNECFFDVVVDIVDLLEAVDVLDEAQLSIVLDDGQLLVFVLLQTLA